MKIFHANTQNQLPASRAVIRMKHILLNTAPARVFLLAFGSGDEVMSGLLSFAAAVKPRASSFSGIGALREVTFASYDPQIKDYRKITMREQVELLSILGNLFTHEGKHKIHAHVTAAKPDGPAFGGHLFKAIVRPTLELIVTEYPADINRKFDPGSCLPLIAL